jgi:hypothetical protein
MILTVRYANILVSNRRDKVRERGRREREK